MPEKFVVPQFIDVESKVFGPVTARQFIIMLAGGLFMFIEYALFDFALFLTAAVGTTIFILVLAFVKINGQNFHYFLLNLFTTLKKPSLRVWKKTQMGVKKFKDKKTKIIQPTATKPKLHQLKGKSLSEIALVVNTGGYYKGE